MLTYVYVHTCQAGCYGRLSATISIFFFIYLYLFICFYSFLTILQHHMFPGSWLWGSTCLSDSRQVFFFLLFFFGNLFFKAYQPLEHQLQAVGVRRVKRSKNTPRYIVSVSFSLLQNKKTKKKKKKNDKIWHMFIGYTGYCVASSGYIPIQITCKGQSVFYMYGSSGTPRNDATRNATQYFYRPSS